MSKGGAAFLKMGLIVLLCCFHVSLATKLFDLNTALRQIDRLKMSNDTKDINTLNALLSHVRAVNPDILLTNEATTSGDIATVSTKYANLGCDLVAATHNTSSTTYLTFHKLNDGLGNFVVQLIKALAFTYHRGWNFLGVQGEIKVAFGNHEDDVLNFYFGNYVPLMTSPSAFPNNSKVVALGPKVYHQSAILTKSAGKNLIYNMHTTRFELERYISKLPGQLSDESIKNQTNEFFSPSFLSLLRGNAACGVRHARVMVSRPELDMEPPSAITVVAHIRIGDVFLNDEFAYKRIPLQYYPLIFSLIRKLCPLCKLFAFTSVQHSGQLKTLGAFRESLQALNVTFYIDQEYSKNSTDTALNTIAHFASADVFLTAKSEFSVVAAYLNPNCIIYSTYAANFPLHDWMVIPYAHHGRMMHPSVVKETLSVIETQLPGCLAQKLSHKLSA